MTRRFLLFVIAACLAGLPSVAFADPPESCEPGEDENCAGPPAPDDGIDLGNIDVGGVVGGDNGAIGDAAGEVGGEIFGDGVGNFLGEYGDDFLNGYDLIRNFSFGGLLTGVCSATTSDAQEEEEAENQPDNPDANGDGVPDDIDINNPVVTPGSSGNVACDASDTYQNISYMTENYEQVLSIWGKNLATDFLQYDLGMGSHLTRDQLGAFSQQLETAIMSDNGNEIIDVMSRIADEKIDIEAQNAANAPKDSPEGRFHDVMMSNPNFRAANERIDIEKADNILAQGRSIANAVESGNIAEQAVASETMKEIDKKYREEFVPVAEQTINAAPSTRSAVNQMVLDLLTQGELISTGLTNMGEGIKVQALQAAYSTNELAGIHQVLRQDRLEELSEKKAHAMQQVNSYVDNVNTATGNVEGVILAVASIDEAQASTPLDLDLFNY